MHTLSPSYRLGGVTAAYKIVPDEIDEIKVTAFTHISKQILVLNT